MTTTKPSRRHLFRRRSLILTATLAAGLALLPGVPPAAAASKGVLLRYGLKPAAVYNQEAVIALDMKIDPSTLPEGMAGLVQSMSKDMRQEITLRGRIDVQPKAADGSMPFTFKIVDAKGAIVHGTETKALSGVSGIVNRPPVSARISADRRRVEMAAVTDPAQAPSDRARDQLAQSLPDLPEHEVKVGDSFEAVVPVSVPGAGGRGENRAEARWVYTLRAVESGQARFEVRQILEGKTTAEMSKGRSFTMTGGATGTATFDLKEGLFTALDLDTDMGMTVTMPMPPGMRGMASPPAAGDAGTASPPAAAPPTELTVGSKVSGPVRMTMGRVSS